MTKNMSSQHTRRKQLFKKRKLDMNNISSDDLSDIEQTSKEERINANHIKKENEGSPIKRKNDNITLQINNYMTKERRNVSECSNSNDELANSTGSCFISLCKKENLSKTHIENEELNELLDVKAIKKEISSPIRFSPRNLRVRTTEKKKHCHEENNKFIKRKRRRTSDITEYDQLSDSVKTELYENSINDMEHIEMLHDLDSVMDFEDVKIPNFLYSTSNNVGDGQTTEISNDPQIDPLLINNNNIRDGIIGNEETEEEKENVQSRFYLRKRRKETSNLTNRVKAMDQTQINNKELFDTPIAIKNALGKLCIDSDTEDEEMSESTKEKLYNLKVQITHDVPLQHQVERTAGSRTLSRLEEKLFLKYASLKKGSFLPQEDEIIISNWKKFCEVHEWNPKMVKPFIYVKNGNRYCIRSSEERQKFVQFLANGLPCRSLNSVLQRFKILFGKYKKSFKRYSLVEDEIILSFIKKNSRRKKHNNFSKLAKMLGRKRHSIWLRYHTLKNMQDNQTKKSRAEIEWTLEIIGKIIENLMSITLCEQVKELKDAIIPKVVWTKLEQKLKINYEALREFWIHQLHMQLFCPEPIYLNDIKIKLIEYMYGKGISNAREIIWPSVIKYFEGVTTIFLSRIFVSLVQETSKKLNTKNFPDIIEYLYDCKIPDIQNSLTDKFLPRLSYNNGDVKIIDEDADC